jgi:hypothetical protein
MRTREHPEAGLATVEMAVVILLLVTMLFGIMEYGWMFYRIQQVTNAAREGARLAILPDATNADVTTRVDGLLSDWGVTTPGAVTISSLDLMAEPTGQLITVTVSIPYAGNSLTNMSLFATPEQLRASATMAKEGP